MSHKAKITKEQCDWLMEMKENEKDERFLVSEHANNYGFIHRNKIGLDLDTLIRALYIGYEVEMTPEEKVRQFFEECQTHIECSGVNSDIAWWRGRLNGIRHTLEVLEIKVPGVNVDE